MDFKEPWVRRDETVMGGNRLILTSKPIVLPQIEVSGCHGSLLFFKRRHILTDLLGTRFCRRNFSTVKEPGRKPDFY